MKARCWRRKVHEMFHLLLVCAQTVVVGTGGKNNWSWTVVADCIEKEAPEQRQDCSKKISSVSQIKWFKTHCGPGCDHAGTALVKGV